MGTPSDKLIVSFARRLAETNQKWRAELDLRLGPLGLSQARGLILHYLSIHGDGLQQNELAEIVGIRGSTLVRQLDRLESDGWVARRNDPEDRRAKTRDPEHRRTAALGVPVRPDRCATPDLFRRF